MDQAAIDYVLAVRALHAGSVIITHAVEVRKWPRMASGIGVGLLKCHTITDSAGK
jgi:hypothetical protein